MLDAIKEYFKSDLVGASIVSIKIALALITIYLYFQTGKVIVSYDEICRESEFIKSLRGLTSFLMGALVMLYTYRMYTLKRAELLEKDS